MDQSVKVAGTEGKVGGYFCRLPPLNENTAYGRGGHLGHVTSTIGIIFG